MPALRRKPSDNPNKIIREIRSGNSLKSIPNVLIPLWQIKLRERFGINVDREIETVYLSFTPRNVTLP